MSYDSGEKKVIRRNIKRVWCRNKNSQWNKITPVEIKPKSEILDSEIDTPKSNELHKLVFRTLSECKHE